MIIVACRWKDINVPWVQFACLPEHSIARFDRSGPYRLTRAANAHGLVYVKSFDLSEGGHY